jgi:hypothetical protein
MKLLRWMILPAGLLLIVVVVTAQDPNVKHYDKDGLSFDYPANWQFSDQSTAQMQFINMERDGYAEIRIRTPREWLKTPEKVAAARKLIQDQYVDTFASQLQQAQMNPKRSTGATQISGAAAEGAKVRAVMDGEPGGMDSYFNISEDRLVQISIIGSEKEIAKSAAVWDMIRNSLKIAPPPKPSPTPTPKGKP